jgi:hypothetical protein
MMSDLMLKPCRKCGAIERNYRGNCLPCKRAWQNAWTADNKQEKAKRNQQWYENRKDHVKAKSLLWRREHPEKVSKFSKRWRKRHPEKAKEMDARSRHKQRGAAGELSKGILKMLFEAQNGLCACCETPLLDNFEIDHIMPIALGGTNTDDNVQLLTPLCNKRKGHKHPATLGMVTPKRYQWEPGDIEF